MTLIDLNKYKQNSQKSAPTEQSNAHLHHSQSDISLLSEDSQQFSVPETFSLHNRFKARNFIESFSFALAGLSYILKTEKNFRIEGLLALLVVSAGIAFHISMMHWLAIIIAIGFVLTIETINTALEYLVDLFTQGEFDMRAKVIKDMAAGACVIASITAAFVGVCVFTPYLMAFIVH